MKKTTEKNNTNRRATFKYAKSAGPTKNRGAQEAGGGKDFFVPDEKIGTKSTDN
ncbi:hypothetical protein [Cyclobacterium sp. SYSU L10401]|uniref:hypothetical protein n=1 Tax=Cyclobacterium sp. SYSU L10401 TaxID=2678657 RepID=UPI0013D545A5|nr:hypothetical protein [Cyclobacterium sp. SYSU L10401]